MRSDQANLSGAAGLADARSALWALRWSVPKFMVTDEAGRKKIADNEQTPPCANMTCATYAR